MSSQKLDAMTLVDQALAQAKEPQTKYASAAGILAVKLSLALEALQKSSDPKTKIALKEIVSL